MVAAGTMVAAGAAGGGGGSRAFASKVIELISLWTRTSIAQKCTTCNLCIALANVADI